MCVSAGQRFHHIDVMKNKWIFDITNLRHCAPFSSNTFFVLPIQYHVLSVEQFWQGLHDKNKSIDVDGESSGASKIIWLVPMSKHVRPN